MRPDPIEKAVAEICRAMVVEDGLPERTGNKNFTQKQIWKANPRTEKVLTEMCDEIARDKAANKPPKRQRHRTRRSRIVVWRRG